MPDPENFLNGHQMINHVQFDIPGYVSTSVILPTPLPNAGSHSL